MSKFAIAPVFILVAISTALHAEITSIREGGAGGKRLLVVDGQNIRPDPAGNRLLFIDGDNIRPDPGGKRLLFIDGQNVRPDPAGIRLAFLDGKQIRRSPGGKVLLWVSHPDVRPDHTGERIYFIDGPALSKQQLVAVLYQLKPELFKLSAEEEAALKKDMADAAAEDEANAKKDPFVGKYSLLSFSSSDDRKAAGNWVVAKKGQYYQIAFKNTKTNEAWEGVGFYVELFGDKELWAAIGPQASMALARYTADDAGNYDGAWVPHYLLDDPKSFGTEKLKKTADNNYTVDAGKAPKTLAEYKGGTCVFTPQKKDINADAKTFLINWTLGDFKVTGIGFVHKKQLVVAAGGKDATIVRLKMGNGSMGGDFMTTSGAFGYYTLSKDE